MISFFRIGGSSESSRIPRSEHLLVVLIFPLAATLAAIGRTCDYKHHWQDVCAGSLLGMLSAFIGYRQFYPSIGDKKATLSFMEQKALSDDAETKIYDLGIISIDDGRRRPT
jgi:membrane-associated phospholipid phosphatase